MNKTANILKAKSLKEIIQSFCDKYDVDYPNSTKDFNETIRQAIRKCKSEKYKHIHAQNYWKAANLRDEEQMLLKYLTLIENGDINKWYDYAFINFE